jgi:hypothetical protein
VGCGTVSSREGADRNRRRRPFQFTDARNGAFGLPPLSVRRAR